MTGRTDLAEWRALAVADSTSLPSPSAGPYAPQPDDRTSVPRTLVISEAPLSAANGFGVTLTTFFQGWPGERLLQFYTRAEFDPDPEDRARTVFGDIPGHWGRRYAIEWMCGQRPAWRGRYSARWLRHALGRWRPDVVYTMTFSADTLAFASWVARRLGRPLVAHIADDGLEVPKARPERDVRALLAGAAARISISEEMRLAYLARYGLDSRVLHNGASLELLRRRSIDTPGPVFCVRYLGSVLPEHHFNAIEDVAIAVRERLTDLNVRFEVCGGAYTRHHAQSLADGTRVVYRGAVGPAEAIDLVTTADLLVIPVNFSPEAFNHVRLSLPTKLPEYLASGTPTLVYGPAGAAPVEFCRRHSVGFVIDTRSVDRVAAFIRHAAADRIGLRQSAEPHREFVRQRYAAPVVQAQFRAAIASVLEKPSS